jgi:pilus assembly protein CpaB
MARRRGWILVTLGLVLAVVTGTVVYYLLQQAAPVAAVVENPPTPVPVVSVPVAARPLTLGTTISDTDVLFRDVPQDVPLVNVITDTETLVGQTVIAPVAEGEFFRPAQIRNDNSPLSTQITPEKVVLAFTSEDLLNKAKVLREGDHIDLLLTLGVTEESATETRSGQATNITLQNILVFRIVRDQPTEENPQPDPKSLLFEMAPQDAVVAKFIKDSGGIIDFTLRSPQDVDTFNTEAINQDYLFDNFNFRAPRSSSRPRQE